MSSHRKADKSLDLNLPNSCPAPASDSTISGDEERLACIAVLQHVIRRFHSEVGSPLAAMGLQLEMVRLSGSCDQKTVETLEEIGKGLGAVIDTVRESIKELRELEQHASSLEI